jgi:PAS domain S-box-containing protein
LGWPFEVTQQGSADCDYRAIFEATGDGILIVDQRSGLVVDANPAMCRMAGYACDEMVGMDPISIVHPNSRQTFEERVRGREMSAADDRVSLVGVRRDGSTVDVEVQVHTFALRGKLARLGVVRDVTERVRAFELLEQRVLERTRELSAILDVTRAVNATLELPTVLGLVLDRLGSIVEYSEAAILLVEGDQLCVSDYRGRLAREQIVGMRFPAASAVVFQAVVSQDGPVIIDNLEGDSPVAVAYRDWAARQAAEAFVSAHSVLAVPLKVKGQVIGQLRLDHHETNFYRQRHGDLALAFANQAATTIDNARLFEAERRGRENLEVALTAGQMGTWEWEAATGRVTWSAQLEAIHGLAPGAFPQTFEAYFSDVHPEDLERVKETISRSLEQGVHHLEYRIVLPDGRIRWVEARGQVIRDPHGRPLGMRGVCMDVSARKEAEEERNRLLAREQAAVEANAALEERHKLARELHDSVSQALYGIGTAALTARIALEDDHDAAAAGQALGYVISMADVGLAEMRALISELRPEWLAQHGLVAALERHVASVRGRHGLRVDTQLGVEPELPLPTKEALYRIAREALHNTVKHARATSARLVLRSQDDATVLEIVDDGVGFDPKRAYPGHLGLASMAERATAAGGELTVESAAGRGTRVSVQLPRTS